MPLELTLKQSHPIPLEVEKATIEFLRESTVDEISRLHVHHGNQEVELGEFFNVQGSAQADSEVFWIGDCNRVKYIGAGLTSGRMVIEGNAGMHLGAEMQGGEILLRGNAADWVGAEMHGGRIFIQGNAGHLVGAAYRGARRGMTGGEIFITGDAGNEIGLTMRRGLIAIAGKSGDFPGANMIAGTILLGGPAGIRPAPSMRRGTLIFLDPQAPQVLPSFFDAGIDHPIFLKFLYKQLAQRGFPIDPTWEKSAYRRYRGDFLETGKGEIFVRLAG